MNRVNNTHNLASILGIDTKVPDIDVKKLKKAAFLRYKELLKGDDVEAQMAALDDYIAIRDLDDGETD